MVKNVPCGIHMSTKRCFSRVMNDGVCGGRVGGRAAVATMDAFAFFTICELELLVNFNSPARRPPPIMMLLLDPHSHG